jgi:hypothetical protein
MLLGHKAKINTAFSPCSYHEMFNDKMNDEKQMINGMNSSLHLSFVIYHFSLSLRPGTEMFIKVWQRFLFLLRWDRFDRERDAEIRFHLR